MRAWRAGQRRLGRRLEPVEAVRQVVYAVARLA